MPLWIYQLSTTLAQAAPLDDGDAPAPVKHAAPKDGISFSGFTQGLRDYNNGDTSNAYLRNILIVIIAVIILIGVLLYLRQRRKEGAAPDSFHKLTRELTRKLKLPFAARLTLVWVSKTTKVPTAAMLISAQVYDQAIAAWSQKPTFLLARRWGAQRLASLKPTLFD